VFGAVWEGDVAVFGGFLQPFPEFVVCRSELAREKLKDAAFLLVCRAIVEDFREQARSKRVA